MSSLARQERMHGMSLLELLLVLALVALAATLGMTVYGGGLEGIRIRSSAKEIAAQLRFTRAQAIARGQPQRFEIDPARRRWQAAGVHHGQIPKLDEVNFWGAREVQPSVGIGSIVFFDDGGSTGGRIRLRSHQALWQIDVAWLTGSVTVSRLAAEKGRQ